jgi:hypothetical protein
VLTGFESFVPWVKNANGGYERDPEIPANSYLQNVTNKAKTEIATLIDIYKNSLRIRNENKESKEKKFSFFCRPAKERKGKPSYILAFCLLSDNLHLII